MIERADLERPPVDGPRQRVLRHEGSVRLAVEHGLGGGIVTAGVEDLAEVIVERRAADLLREQSARQGVAGGAAGIGQGQHGALQRRDGLELAALPGDQASVVAGARLLEEMVGRPAGADDGFDLGRFGAGHRIDLRAQHGDIGEIVQQRFDRRRVGRGGIEIDFYTRLLGDVLDRRLPAFGDDGHFLGGDGGEGQFLLFAGQRGCRRKHQDHGRSREQD